MVTPKGAYLYLALLGAPFTGVTAAAAPQAPMIADAVMVAVGAMFGAVARHKVAEAATVRGA